MLRTDPTAATALELKCNHGPGLSFRIRKTDREAPGRHIVELQQGTPAIAIEDHGLCVTGPERTGVHCISK